MSTRAWKRITANGRTWVLAWRKDMDLDDDGECDGAMFPDGRTILLNAKLKKDPEELLDTLVHELMHAAFYSEDVVEPSEEGLTRVARTLAQLLTPFMRKLP